MFVLPGLCIWPLTGEFLTNLLLRQQQRLGWCDPYRWNHIKAVSDTSPAITTANVIAIVAIRVGPYQKPTVSC